MKIPPHILERKGARKTSEVPSEVLDLLNKGVIECKNLMELLVVSHQELLKHVLPEIEAEHYKAHLQLALEKNNKLSSWKNIETVGSTLNNSFSNNTERERVLKLCSRHTSDMVRQYACYLISGHPIWSLEEKFNQIRMLANDSNPGVRETAWLALRNQFIDNLKPSIRLLKKWVKDPEANIRRFATELTRPNGVWCLHVQELKENPLLAIDLLEPLKNDESKYVQDSVSNWLNDSSKSKPEFVIKLCEKWGKESPTKNTARIIKRSLRTLNKQ